MIVNPDTVYLARSPIDRADAPFATYRELAYRTLAALEVPLPGRRHHLTQTQRHRALIHRKSASSLTPGLSAACSTACATAAYPPSAWWLPTASPGKTPRPGTLGHCAAIAP